MAFEKFTVFFNKQVCGNMLGGGGVYKELTTAEGTAFHRKFSSKGCKIFGPLQQCELVEIEAEGAEAACTAAVHLLGLPQSEGELTVIKTSSLETKSGA